MNALDSARHPILARSSDDARLTVADHAWSALYRFSPPPGSVLGWYTLYRDNVLVALLGMDLFYVVDNVLAGLIIVGLLVALWQVARAVMVAAATLGLLGAAAFFASNPAFSMFTLSSQYWNATSEVQRSIYLAAGEAMMSTWQGSAYLVSYELGAIATLLISLVMLRSEVFSRLTGFIGIAAGVLMLWPPVNNIGIVISLLSLGP